MVMLAITLPLCLIHNILYRQEVPPDSKIQGVGFAQRNWNAEGKDERIACFHMVAVNVKFSLGLNLERKTDE